MSRRPLPQARRGGDVTREDWKHCYALLVTLAGAATEGYSNADAFADYMTGDGRPYEWRFQGSLGFGGKLHWTGRDEWPEDVPRVSCYREDETTQRLETMRATNAALHEWWAARRPPKKGQTP